MYKRQVLYLFLTTKYAKNAKKSDELVSHVLLINPVNFAEFHHSLLHNPGLNFCFIKFGVKNNKNTITDSGCKVRV